MFGQLFGKYLVDEKVITKDIFDSILEEQTEARVKLGTIAVAEGMLSEAQADEINHLQTQMDKRFGDIAVEKGFLKEEQIEVLLKKQGNATMKFYQILIDKSGLTMAQIEDYLEKFKTSHGFSEVEMTALKEEDVDRLVPLFAATMNTMVSTLAGLVIKNITRFVTSNFYPERMRKAKEYEYTVFAGQAVRGEQSIYLGFAAKDDMGGIIELAKGFARGTTISGSEEIYDAVCEFSNLNNGLLASESSKNGISIDMLPPEVYISQKLIGSAYVMPIVVNGKTVDMIISVDEGFKPGENVHKVEISKVSAEVKQSLKGSILVVDDSALIRKMLRALLENNGYSVVGEAANGKEAVEMYKSLKPDVVTLDITMPVMDGVSALKEIIGIDADAKAVMITAAGQQDKVVEALKLGALQFIMKPFNEEDVLRNFKNILG